MVQTAPPGRRHLLFVRPGEDESEAIKLQKRELGATDEDAVIGEL